jgi:hypothetical protein
MLEFRVRNLFGRWMARKGWAGVCIPLPFVTVICYWLLNGADEPAPWTIVHEREHAAQAARYGVWGFWVRYWFWLVIDGYQHHPMEIEARDAANRTLTGRT